MLKYRYKAAEIAGISFLVAAAYTVDLSLGLAASGLGLLNFALRSRTT